MSVAQEPRSDAHLRGGERQYEKVIEVCRDGVLIIPNPQKALLFVRDQLGLSRYVFLFY